MTTINGNISVRVPQVSEFTAVGWTGADVFVKYWKDVASSSFVLLADSKGKTSTGKKVKKKRCIDADNLDRAKQAAVDALNIVRELGESNFLDNKKALVMKLAEILRLLSY